MYRQYLAPARGRPNLTVRTGAKTTRVALEAGAGGARRAVGVEYLAGDSAQRQTAGLKPGGEVLMCAGAVHTPQLLMLSGIGPAAALRAHGIEVHVDAPGVGAGLQDHPAIVLAHRMKPELDDGITVTSQIYDKKSNIKPAAVLQYLFGRRGPLTTTGCDHGAFVSTTGGGQPDLQVRFVPAMSLDPDGVSAYAIFGELKRLGLSWPGGFTMQLLAVRPRSRGSVTLRSADPLDRPEIDVGYLTDAGGADLKTLVAGLRMARDVASRPSLAQYASGEEFPGAGVESDADIEAYIRRTVHSGNALVGTAAMGASAAAGAVVSSADLSVFGVAGLRVVDASVLPRIPGGQTGAAAIMVAERTAAAMVGGKTVAATVRA